jgi:hypothetical protein
VGVCCDAIVIRGSLSPLAPADLDAAEAKLKLKLPAEYRALLLNHNGGELAYGQPGDAPEGRFSPSEIESFIPVRPTATTRKDMWDLVEAGQFVQSPRTTGTGILRDYVPFANGGEGDLYLLGVRGRVAGRVAYFSDYTHNAWDPTHLDVLFPSVGALLVSIVETAPEWWRHARNGDTAALCAWIDAGGDPNAHNEHPAHEGETALLVAAWAGNAPMVRALLARGAKPDAELRQALPHVPGAGGRAVRAAFDAWKKGKKK